VKRILALVPLMGMLGLAVPGAYPQQVTANGPITGAPYLGFGDDATAEQAVREIMEAIGRPAGSVTVRPGDVPNAEVRPAACRSARSFGSQFSRSAA
jgi:hypothetical protein